MRLLIDARKKIAFKYVFVRLSWMHCCIMMINMRYDGLVDCYFNMNIYYENFRWNILLRKSLN